MIKGQNMRTKHSMSQIVLPFDNIRPASACFWMINCRLHQVLPYHFTLQQNSTFLSTSGKQQRLKSDELSRKIWRQLDLMFPLKHQMPSPRSEIQSMHNFKPLQPINAVHFVCSWRVTRRYAPSCSVVGVLQHISEPKTSSPEMFGKHMHKDVTDLLRPEIISKTSRLPCVRQGLRPCLHHWLQNSVLFPFTLSSLSFASFCSSSIWYHPPNWSQAQILCPLTSWALVFEQSATRSSMPCRMSTSGSEFAFLALLLTFQSGSVRRNSSICFQAAISRLHFMWFSQLSKVRAIFSACALYCIGKRGSPDLLDFTEHDMCCWNWSIQHVVLLGQGWR